MKLTIIRLQRLSAQDISDLQKIWPQEDIAALEQTLDDDHRLYAARFNDRLLAAVRMVVKEETGTLSQLTVREVTRRRGVGQYLLEDTLAQNPHITRWSVTLDGSEAAGVIAAFMQAAGFEAQPDGRGYISQQIK